MKKRVLSLVAAVMVMTMGTTVFAAKSPSPTTVEKDEAQKVKVETVETKTAEEYVKAVTVTGGTATAVSKETVAATAAQVKEVLNNVAKVAETIKSDSLKTAATDSTKKIVPTIKTVVDVAAPAGTTVSERSPIELTFAVEGIKAGANIVVLHWNGSAWETIKPESVADGKVTAKFTSLSPIAIVELAVEDVKTSPATGEAASVLPVLAVICMAGALVCGKKVVFNN